MTNLRHLIVDLRAHAHEVPEHIGALMRKAAAARDGCEIDAEPQPAPFPPPSEKADAQG